MVIGIGKHQDRLHELIGILDYQHIFRDALNYSYDIGYNLFGRWRNQSFQTNVKNIGNSYLSILKSKQDLKCKTMYFPSMLSLRKLDNISDEQNSKYNTNMWNISKGEYFKEINEINKDNIKTGQEVYQDMKKCYLV